MVSGKKRISNNQQGISNNELKTAVRVLQGAAYNFFELGLFCWRVIYHEGHEGMGMKIMKERIIIKLFLLAAVLCGWMQTGLAKPMELTFYGLADASGARVV